MVWLPSMANACRYPLHRFTESKDDLKQLFEFLARGGDPNKRILGSKTLLHVAAQSYERNDRVVKKLIHAKAEIELTTSMGHTPLQCAVISRNRGAVKALILAKAEINVQNVFGRTALHYAISTFPPRCTSDRFSWMHIVRSSPDVWIIKRLLSHDDIDINLVDSQSETPLMWAVKCGSLSAVKLLLKRGANPNIPNKQGQNCLHVALSVQNISHCIAIELLMNGTGIYDVDKNGQTPVDILLQNAVNDSVFDEFFEQRCLALMAFKYHIREELVLKLGRNRRCLEYLRNASQEVQRMRDHIICDGINLHDFATGCFQERGRDNTLKIHRQVVESVIENFQIYFFDIFNHVSLPELYSI